VASSNPQEGIMLSSYMFASEELVTLPRVRRLRLRSIDMTSVAALRELFCQRDILHTGGMPELTWHFCWLARTSARWSIVLRGAGAEVFLSLTEDGLREPLGCREWWDYAGESRLLAWTLAHTALLEALGRVFGESLLPDGWSEPPGTEADATVALAFEASSAADHGSIRGELLLPPIMLAQLAANLSWGKHVPAVDDWASRLRADLRMVLPAAAVPCRELIAARYGDVLVLGSRPDCWGRLALIYPARSFPRGGSAAGRTWSARYDDGRLEIAGAALDESTRMLMSEPIAEETSGVARGSSLDSVAVTLDFEVGTLSVPLGELAAIKPGYVFELAARLEDARVVIRANGTLVGRGELVAVGDTLGVQLLSIDAHGFR
jgi:type III secretion protein Q